MCSCVKVFHGPQGCEREALFASLQLWKWQAGIRVPDVPRQRWSECLSYVLRVLFEGSTEYTCEECVVGVENDNRFRLAHVTPPHTHTNRSANNVHTRRSSFKTFPYQDHKMVKKGLLQWFTYKCIWIICRVLWKINPVMKACSWMISCSSINLWLYWCTLDLPHLSCWRPPLSPPTGFALFALQPLAINLRSKVTAASVVNSWTSWSLSEHILHVQRHICNFLLMLRNTLDNWLV